MDKPLQTFVNTASGIKLVFQTSGLIKSVFTENYYLSFRDGSFTKLQPYIQGNGVYLNAGFKTKTFDLIASYWKGDGFQSIKGAPIYQSVSSQISNEGYIQDARELLFLRLVSDFKISENFIIGTRLEPYIDLQNPKFEFSNSLISYTKRRLS